MSVKRAVTILSAILVSVLAGFMVRTIQPQYDDCVAASLDAILAGGNLHLADDCVLMLDFERVITGDVTITGGMLHGGGMQRVLRVAVGANLKLKNVEVRVGIAELEPQDGGGIYNEGSLTLIDSRMKGNRAKRGGAIFNTGNLILIRSQIDHNSAREVGGGIYNTGTLSISQSIIAGNMATLDGNGIVNAGGIVEAKNNYWGYPSGPRAGQIVGVDASAYTPWLKSAPNWTPTQADDSHCSEAALDAVLAGGEITLPERCLIYISEAKVITGDVVIRGTAYTGLFANGEHRILEIAKGASLRMENMLITGGFVQTVYTGGAGILNRGELTLINSEITGNRTTISYGTGIFNTGSLILEDSKIHHNYNTGGMGAGIFNMGQARIYTSTIADNTIYSLYEEKQTPEFGGGIYNIFGSQILLSESQIWSNSAPNAAGIMNLGILVVEDSDIAFNATSQATGCLGDGGGIFNSGIATIRQSKIRNNNAGRWGGGIDNQGRLEITDAQILTNSACIGGGGIFNAFTQANLNIRNSIIAHNISQERPERNNGLYNLISTDYDIGRVQAQNNYWGSSDGPAGDGSGSGDGVSGVERDNFTPWLESPPDWAQEE